MSKGFIKLPREFLNSKDWLTLKSSDRDVFNTILQHAAFAPTKFNNHESIIDLNPGDLCISGRELADLCAPDITYKMVRGALDRLSSRNLISQNRSQRRAQEKMIISVTNQMVYDACFCEKGAKKGAARAQPGRTKEEDKEDKEEKEKVKKEKSKNSIDEKPKEALIHIRESIPLTQTQIDRIKNDLKEDFDPMLDSLNSYLLSGGRNKIQNLEEYCYGKLQKGSWVYNQLQEDKAKLLNSVKTTTFSVNQKQIPTWQKQQDDARLYAHKVSKEYLSKYCDIVITHDSISFRPHAGADTTPTDIKFKENGFKDQVDSLLRKKGFDLKIQPIAQGQK